VASYLDQNSRTHMCGDLRAANEGDTVTLFGWVANTRDLGGLLFADLRDRTGIVQVRFDPDYNTDALEAAKALRNEWCVAIEGKVVSRGENTTDKLATGEVEVLAPDGMTDGTTEGTSDSSTR